MLQRMPASLSEEDTFLPISALQHFVYCERRAALIHVLGRWEENAHTAMGRVLHERVDGGETTTRPEVQILRNVALSSRRLKLRGIADVVEVHRTPSGLRYFPVEYKKGKHRHLANNVQLGAQAMAIEEMTNTIVNDGAIFLAGRKRRNVVVIDEAMRSMVVRIASQLHELVANRRVPSPSYEPRRCDDCSLRKECGPEIALEADILKRRLREVLK